MNLTKITKISQRYIEKVKDTKTPNVYELYCALGEEVIGRKIYSRPRKNKDYYNKCKKHKLLDGYIGKPHKDFYAQEMVNVYKEWRIFCVNGNASNFQYIADKIRKEFKIRDFVFDVYRKSPGHTVFLMEVNEIHLSSLEQSGLSFIYKQIL